MKDILNIMRFDFLTAKTTALPIFGVIAVMCNALGLLFSPMMFVYVLMAASFLIVQLQTYAEKYGFHKLYGILPIERKTITRGRFQYIFWTFFAVEIFELIMTKLALVLKLYRILPNQENETMQFVAETFNAESTLNYSLIVGIFVVMCVFFSYMQMMGQIFGQENEMKIVMITLAVITVGALAFFGLDSYDIIPHINVFPDFAAMSLAKRTLWYIGLNAGAFVCNVLFGEITAGKVSVREL